jgi:hypothetical protein
MMRDSGVHAHDLDAASLAAGVAQKSSLAHPHQANRGTGGKDYYLFGIEPGDNDHNAQLPWNLPGQEL